jgi:hypothetical protein
VVISASGSDITHQLDDDDDDDNNDDDYDYDAGE